MADQLPPLIPTGEDAELAQLIAAQRARGIGVPPPLPGAPPQALPDAAKGGAPPPDVPPIPTPQAMAGATTPPPLPNQPANSPAMSRLPNGMYASGEMTPSEVLMRYGRGGLTPESTAGFQQRAAATYMSPAMEQLSIAMGGNGRRMPTMTEATELGIHPEQYARMIGETHSHDLASSRFGIDAATAFGTGGAPGEIANRARLTQSQVDANGMNRLVEQQGGAAYNAFIQQRVANGASIQDANREWRESGMSLPAFAGGVTPGAAPGAAPGNPPPVPEQTPHSRMEQVYRSVQQRQLGSEPGKPPRGWDDRSSSGGITDFVNSLGEGFVNQHTPAVMQHVIDRFGANAANSWFVNRSSRSGTTTPQERAIRLIENAANKRGANVGNSTINPQSPASILNPFGVFSN